LIEKVKSRSKVVSGVGARYRDGELVFAIFFSDADVDKVHYFHGK
jgi:membrane-bound inhibitor of C-type lysozyme